MVKVNILFAFVLFIFCTCFSVTFHVSSQTGSDTADGLTSNNSLKTIAEAINKAWYNDTIILAPDTFYEHSLHVQRHITLIGDDSTKSVVNAQELDRILLVDQFTNVTIKNITLTNGKSLSPDVDDEKGQGGAIFSRGRLRIGNCAIRNSKSADGYGYTYDGVGASGGAIYSADSLFVSNCHISFNTCGIGNAAASGHGGAIYSTGYLYISNSVFNRNSGGVGGTYSQGGNGGAIFNEGNADISNTSFISNNAGNGGGGANRSGGNGGSGGAIYSSGTIVIKGCILDSNAAGKGGNAGNGGGGDGGHGGAIALFDTTLIVDCIIRNNAAGDSGLPGYAAGGKKGVGGGLYAAAPCSISLSQISGNSAKANGGGIYSAAALTISQCELSYNSSLAEGGAIHYSDSLLTIINSTLAENHAEKSGGAIKAASGNVNLVHSTLCFNSSIGYGAGVANSVSGVVSLANSIIAANFSRDGMSDLDSNGIYMSSGYNLVWNPGSNAQVFSADGSILFQDPLLGRLTNNGGKTKSCALSKGSPALDIIPDSNGYLATTDQRGILRPFNINGDIGAYEYYDLSSVEKKKTPSRRAGRKGYKLCLSVGNSREDLGRSVIFDVRGRKIKAAGVVKKASGIYIVASDNQ